MLSWLQLHGLMCGYCCKCYTAIPYISSSRLYVRAQCKVQIVNRARATIVTSTENKNLIVVLTFTTIRINLSDFPLNFTVLSVVATIGNEVICAVKFNTAQFKLSSALVKLTLNSVTLVRN